MAKEFVFAFGAMVKIPIARPKPSCLHSTLERLMDGSGASIEKKGNCEYQKEVDHPMEGHAEEGRK